MTNASTDNRLTATVGDDIVKLDGPAFEADFRQRSAAILAAERAKRVSAGLQLIVTEPDGREHHYSAASKGAATRIRRSAEARGFSVALAAE